MSRDGTMMQYEKVDCIWYQPKFKIDQTGKVMYNTTRSKIQQMSLATQVYRTRSDAPPSEVTLCRVFMIIYRRPRREGIILPESATEATVSAEGARTIACPVWQQNKRQIVRVRVKRGLTCNLTTSSKASIPVKSAETCRIKCSHQEGEENLCKIVSPHRSSSTGGTTVGSRRKSIVETVYGQRTLTDLECWWSPSLKCASAAESNSSMHQ